jgi:AbrB family looped-hinge helix DNA binding protein
VEYKVSSQGQVTLPKFVRDALGIEPGDPLEFEVRGGEFVGRKKHTGESGIDWVSVYGAHDFGGLTTDQVMAWIRP